MSFVRFWGGLFLLAAALNILAGHAWLALAGHPADPETALRLLRLRQGIAQGHLVNLVRLPGTAPPGTVLPGTAPPVLTPWSRLLDILLWIIAAPLAPLLGWTRALAAGAAILAPLSLGGLGVALAFAARPLAEDRLLWVAAVAAALLPGLAAFAGPGMAREQILAAALLAAAAGFLLRASRSGSAGQGFFAGLLGGFAVWLAAAALPVFLLGFIGLLWRWARPGQGRRLGGAILACAAGFIDPLGFGFALDPPQGGYLVTATYRLSIVFIVLALLLLAGAQALQRLPQWRHFERHGRSAGLGIMAAIVLLWIVLFPKVLTGPRLLLTGTAPPPYGAGAVTVLLPGLFAFAYCLWRAAPSAAWPWIYAAFCTLVLTLLAGHAAPFGALPSAIAAALLPVALSEARQRRRGAK